MSRRTKSTRGPAALGLPPATGSIYEQALTHRSYAFEQPEPPPHNERLEFLGDAILGAVIAGLLYRSYPDLSEGEMTRLRAAVVERQPLAELARHFGLGEHIRLGKGEDASGGRDKPSLLADTFEALIAALYLDKGIEEVQAFISEWFEELLEEAVGEGGGHDPKSALQEVLMRRGGNLPTYRVATSGPEHDRRFTADVFVGGDSCGSGFGRTKKDAEQEAAAEALRRLGVGPETVGEAALKGGEDARAS